MRKTKKISISIDLDVDENFTFVLDKSHFFQHVLTEAIKYCVEDDGLFLEYHARMIKRPPKGMDDRNDYYWHQFNDEEKKKISENIKEAKRYYSAEVRMNNCRRLT